MNEQNLRDRWGAVLEESPDFQKAKYAATRDKVAREAKYKALRRQHAGAPAKLMELWREERAEDGTGSGEIQLSALRRMHEGQVNKYLSDARQKQQQEAVRPGIGYRPPSEPDFAQHTPWQQVRPRELGMSPAEMIRTAEDRATRNGQPFTTKQRISAARALASETGAARAGSALIPQELQDAHNRETAARLAAFDEEAANSQVADFVSNRQLQHARKKVRNDVLRARGVEVLDKAEEGGPEAMPYGMSPGDFVRGALSAKSQALLGPYPTVERSGKRNPDASVADSPTSKEMDRELDRQRSHIRGKASYLGNALKAFDEENKLKFTTDKYTGEVVDESDARLELEDMLHRRFNPGRYSPDSVPAHSAYLERKTKYDAVRKKRAAILKAFEDAQSEEREFERQYGRAKYGISLPD